MTILINLDYNSRHMHDFATISGDRAELSNHGHQRTPPPVAIKPFSVPGDVTNVERKASCSCGGGCSSCAKESERMNVQTKLAVSMPGDRDEQEADSVADQMVQMKSSPCSCGGGCGSCQAKSQPAIQRKASESSAVTQPGINRSVL